MLGAATMAADVANVPQKQIELEFACSIHHKPQKTASNASMVYTIPPCCRAMSLHVLFSASRRMHGKYALLVLPTHKYGVEYEYMYAHYGCHW